jgi:DNA-directed RNA polymerase subunit beta'
MSTTTIGQLLIQGALPPDVALQGPLDKGGTSKLLQTIAEHHPKQYGTVVQNLRDVGNQIALESGSSFSINDLKPHTDLRDAAFKSHMPQLLRLRHEAALNPELNRSLPFQQKKLELFAKVEEHVNNGIKAAIESRPNNLTSWIKSGARGDTSMGRQMLGMVGLNLDTSNHLLPVIAQRSFSEGMSPIDFYVHAQGARRGLVNTYTAVRDPGAFAKELNTIHMDMVVTDHDCKTTHGRELPANSPDLIGRALAEDVPGVGHRNDIITNVMRERLAKQRTVVKIRSPLFCTAPKGVCAVCTGLNEEGRLPPVGEHVGLKAAQGLTAPLTQLALNQKHAGGVVGASKSPLQTILQFMHAPKMFAGAATLAHVSGEVTHVEPAAAGGLNVTVKNIKHYVAPGLDVTVKPGQRVAKGDPLSHGEINPVDVVEHKGMEAGREFFASRLRQIYADAGIRSNSRVTEVVTRGILNLGQVIHPGTHDYVPGEVVHWNSIQQHLPTAHDTVELGKAEGRILAHETGTASPYTVLTPATVKQLKDQNISHVPVFKQNSLIVKPIMLGTERAALHKDDWMANLAFRFVNQTFRQNAATGARTQIRDTFNPVPAYVHGQYFGQGKDGKY